MNIIQSIGNTSLVELEKIVPAGSARVLVKMESQNPTGSMKDRMAKAVIEGALESGQLRSSDTVVAYTTGSAGTSLALICASLDISITLITSDAFSLEKRKHMRALGATVIEIESDGGRIDKELIRRMISKTEELAKAPNTFFVDQFNTPDAAMGYSVIADEIWQVAPSRVAVFVHGIGTGQSFKGISEKMLELYSDIKIVAIEPSESSVLSGGESGAHEIEGIGPGFIPPLWNPDLVDAIEIVSSEDAKEMTRRLAKEEGLFAGISTGANVLAAIRQAEGLGDDKIVATVMCDTGLKYLTSDLYQS